MAWIQRSRRWAVVAGALTVGIGGGHAASCRGQAWVDSTVSGPFVIRAEFPLGGSQRLLNELAQLQTDLVRYLGVPPATQQIDVYLFRDKKSYAAYLKQNLPNIPYRKALFVQGQGPGRVHAYRCRELPTDLRHECTHALLHAVLPLVPLWLDEGLAEYFEVSARQRAFDNPHLGSLNWSLRFGSVPKIEELEKRGSMAEMSRTDYRSAWAWVHFMLHGNQVAHGELVQYLRDIQARTPPGQLSQRLKWRLPGTEDRFAAHFKHWKR